MRKTKGHRSMTRTSALMFAVITFFAIGSVPAQQPTVESSSSIREISKRRIVAYSPKFAERFRLPPNPHGGGLGAGLEAVEIAFQRNDDTGWVKCHVSLYISSAVDVSDDLPAEASWDLLEPDTHFFLRPRPDGTDPRQLMPRSDAEHLLMRQSRYLQRAGFATVDYVHNKAGGRTSVLLQDHVADLFPGLRYIRTRGCMPSWMIEHRAGIDILLRRRGAPDYSRIVGPWPAEHFARIRLPDAFANDALPSLKAVELYMQDLTEAEMRKRRKK